MIECPVSEAMQNKFLNKWELIFIYYFSNYKNNWLCWGIQKLIHYPKKKKEQNWHALSHSATSWPIHCDKGMLSLGYWVYEAGWSSWYEKKWENYIHGCWGDRELCSDHDLRLLDLYVMLRTTQNKIDGKIKVIIKITQS